MKVMLCGKGGSGKSTITALLARALKNAGKSVLVVDADESNLCLHRLLGAQMPEVLLETMGGRKGAKEKLQPSFPHHADPPFFKDPLTLADLPASCLAEVDGIKLLVIGKIREFGEGCACMLGSISRAVLSRLRESEGAIVLIDAEAGLEHFGRRVDASCDIVLAVVDPSFESIAMAERIRQLAEAAGIEAYFVLNRVDEALRTEMLPRLDAARVIAAVPRSASIFQDSLHGRPLRQGLEEMGAVCRFLEAYSSPPSRLVTS